MIPPKEHTTAPASVQAATQVTEVTQVAQVTQVTGAAKQKQEPKPLDSSDE
jgi:hypothetical protein